MQEQLLRGRNKMKIYNLDDAVNEEDIITYFTASSAEVLDSRLNKEMEFTRHHLALTQNEDYTGATLVSDASSNLTPIAATVAGSQPSSSNIADVPSTSSGQGLSEAEFFDHLDSAIPVALQGKWVGFETWSRNKALSALSYYESGRNPTAKNPTSTAYGLFQFLNSTWKGTGFPKDQAIATDKNSRKAIIVQIAAGLRYVQAVYKTPERALAFQRATVKKDPSGLPDDLIYKYKYWTSRGWSGY